MRGATNTGVSSFAMRNIRTISTGWAELEVGSIFSAYLHFEHGQQTISGHKVLDRKQKQRMETMLQHLNGLVAGMLIASVALGASQPAFGEAKEVRIAQSYGLIYLPSYVAVERKLIEKHAKARGLGDIKVTQQRLTSGPAASDLILSGNADVGMSGSAPMMVLWDKTRGPQKVRGIMAFSDSGVFVVTVDPRIKSLRDFVETDRIAMTQVKSTTYAMILQLAAVKEWGWEQRFKLDPLTVSMGNSEALASLLTGGTEVKTHVTMLPFNVEEMKSGKARTLLTSRDVIDGPMNTSVAYTTERFRAENPNLYSAVVDAFEEAILWINGNKEEAAKVYVKYEPQKVGYQPTLDMMQDENLINFTSTPHNLTVQAEFMFKVGTLKNRPSSWKELFWENVHNKDGN
jgi:NitT/TauT family transport system substrate-binding protein